MQSIENMQSFKMTIVIRFLAFVVLRSMHCEENNMEFAAKQRLNSKGAHSTKLKDKTNNHS
jgi:hypothetical protein